MRQPLEFTGSESINFKSKTRRDLTEKRRNMVTADPTKRTKFVARGRHYGKKEPKKGSTIVIGGIRRWRGGDRHYRAAPDSNSAIPCITFRKRTSLIEMIRKPINGENSSRDASRLRYLITYFFIKIRWTLPAQQHATCPQKKNQHYHACVQQRQGPYYPSQYFLR